jgi:hypothetical protein
MIPIHDDLHQIAARLREVDDRYRVFRNEALGRFEVHTEQQPNSKSLACVVPYERLDERTVDYVRMTRIENFDANLDEITRNNAKVETSAKKAMAEVNATLGDMLCYAERVDRDVTFVKGKRWY